MVGGYRVVKQLEAHKFEAENRESQSTFHIRRDASEHDTFGPMSRCFKRWGTRPNSTRKAQSSRSSRRASRP